jgi:hypothetical protein
MRMKAIRPFVCTAAGVSIVRRWRISISLKQPIYLVVSRGILSRAFKVAVFLGHTIR